MTHLPSHLLLPEVEGKGRRVQERSQVDQAAPEQVEKAKDTCGGSRLPRIPWEDSGVCGTGDIEALELLVPIPGGVPGLLYITLPPVTTSFLANTGDMQGPGLGGGRHRLWS